MGHSWPKLVTVCRKWSKVEGKLLNNAMVDSGKKLSKIGFIKRILVDNGQQ
jgi:hypothetical protein